MRHGVTPSPEPSPQQAAEATPPGPTRNARGEERWHSRTPSAAAVRRRALAPPSREGRRFGRPDRPWCPSGCWQNLAKIWQTCRAHAEGPPPQGRSEEAERRARGGPGGAPRAKSTAGRFHLGAGAPRERSGGARPFAGSPGEARHPGRQRVVERWKDGHGTGAYMYHLLRGRLTILGGKPTSGGTRPRRFGRGRGAGHEFSRSFSWAAGLAPIGRSIGTRAAGLRGRLARGRRRRQVL